MKKLALIPVVVGGVLVGLLGGVASAASNSAVCGFAPGSIHRIFAEGPGPNAGPYAEVAWNGAPDKPNAPGQAVTNLCVGQ